jgi:deoxyribonuclease-4
LLAELKRGLGAAALRQLHMHVSGIAWTEKGERKHLRLRDSSFDWPALLQVLVDRKVSGIMICESPVLEEDALLLKQEYLKRMNRGKGK